MGWLAGHRDLVCGIAPPDGFAVGNCRAFRLCPSMAAAGYCAKFNLRNLGSATAGPAGLSPAMGLEHPAPVGRAGRVRMCQEAMHCLPPSSPGLSQLPVLSLETSSACRSAGGMAPAGRQFTHVLDCRDRFQHLGGGGQIDPAMGGRLGAVVDLDACLPAFEFEMGALGRGPGNGPIGWDRASAGRRNRARPAFDIAEHLPEARLTAIPQTAPALVAIDPNEPHAADRAHTGRWRRVACGAHRPRVA